MRSRSYPSIALTLLLLAAGLTGMAVAQEEAYEEEVSLTGSLSENLAGQLVLIDPESDKEIPLRGSEEELAQHVGSTVTVSGRWAEDEDGKAYFAVSAVRPADA